MRNVSVLIGEIAVSKKGVTHFLTVGSDARQTTVAAKERGQRSYLPLSRSISPVRRYAMSSSTSWS